MNEQERQNLSELLIQLTGKDSQRELARKLGVSSYSLNSWIKQTVIPSTDKLQLIADYMGISLSDLLNRVKPDSDENLVNIPNNAEGFYSLVSKLPMREQLKLAQSILGNINFDSKQLNSD
jgi:transcriptional regulator with XRE-family HTH domain